MVYTDLTRKAINIAYEAHAGQYDISGVPYIFHPFTVAMNMPDETTTCAAILHDVVEDTSLSIDDLSKEFPVEVIDLIRILTHDKKEDYFDYIRKIKQNDRAVIVKLADIVHNMDRTRVYGIKVPENILEKWDTKYRRALEILKED